MKSEYLVVAQFSPTAPTGEGLVVPAKSSIERKTFLESYPAKIVLPDKFMWSECLETESTGGGGSGAHCVDVLTPHHVLVPVLLKRSGQKSESESEKLSSSIQKYLSSPSPPSSARIDSLSSRLVVEVTGGGFGAKLFPPVLAVGYPPPPPPPPDTLPLDELTGLMAV